MLRLFLAASALIWLPYGLVCFFAPTFLAEIAGVASTSTTGTIEIRAMYGGLQAALGVLAGAAVYQQSLQRPALLTLSFVCAGLFMARLLGAVLDAQFSSYTVMGLLFELLSSAFATRLLARNPEPTGKLV
jgi:multidrug transporter EmrE-like cation transporter